MIKLAYVDPNVRQIEWAVTDIIRIEHHSKNWFFDNIAEDGSKKRIKIHPMWICFIIDCPDDRKDLLYDFSQSQLAIPINSFSIDYVEKK